MIKTDRHKKMKIFLLILPEDKQIRNIWKVLKCGAGEGWRRSVGPIMWEMKKYYLRVKEQRNILHEISKRKANWIGHILHRNYLLQRVIEGKLKRGYKWQEDEEEDVGSY